MADTYIRTAGPHVAERVRPEPGTPEEEQYAALAADPESSWQRVGEEPAPGPAAQVPAGRPPQAAPVAEWLAWADTQDPGDHSGLTKVQLIEQYGKGGAV